MKLSTKPSTSLHKTDLLAVLALEGGRLELPSAVELSAAAKKDFTGELRQASLVYTSHGPAERVLLVGLGKKEGLDAEKLRRAVAIVAQRADQAGVASATLWLGDALLAELHERGVDADATGAALAEGAIMGTYRYEEQKSKRKKPKLQSLTFATSGGAGLRRGVVHGTATGEGNAYTRDLQNAPGNVMTPRRMAAEARKLAARSPRIRCTVLDERRMKELGMGLLLGVSRGSVEPARLIHLVHKPKGKPRAKVALVGKGLTFDAGGISIKPAAKMDEMRFDMSGGAAVLGVFHALATIDVPCEVHGIVPCTENLADAAATKPGDVHTAIDGTTVEVLNTDAEGRLILGDALAYTKERVKPDTIIDLATLTGAVVVGLGHETSGMFASTDRLRDDLDRAGRDTSELVWPLPLFEVHREKMRGVNADLRNIGPPDLGAGSTQGAAFLSFFVEGADWCHLDIAGTAWGMAPRDYVGGPLGTGFGTRLLLRYLELRGRRAGRS